MGNLYESALGVGEAEAALTETLSDTALKKMEGQFILGKGQFKRQKRERNIGISSEFLLFSDEWLSSRRTEKLGRGAFQEEFAKAEYEKGEKERVESERIYTGSGPAGDPLMMPEFMRGSEGGQYGASAGAISPQRQEITNWDDLSEDRRSEFMDKYDPKYMSRVSLFGEAMESGISGDWKGVREGLGKAFGDRLYSFGGEEVSHERIRRRGMGEEIRDTGVLEDYLGNYGLYS